CSSADGPGNSMRPPRRCRHWRSDVRRPRIMAERQAPRTDPARGAVLHAQGPKPALLLGTVIPAMVMLVTPSVGVFVWFTHTQLGGSLERLAEWIGSSGLATALVHVWRPVIVGSPAAWTMLAIFATIQLALMRVLPGKASEGSITPA